MPLFTEPPLNRANYLPIEVLQHPERFPLAQEVVGVQEDIAIPVQPGSTEPVEAGVGES